MSYPESEDDFADLSGDDDIASQHQDDRAEAIEAIEGFLGISGANQSQNATLFSFLLKNVLGGRIYKGDDDEVIIDPVAAIIPNVSGSIRKIRVIDEATTLTTSNLDTGVIAADTFYYVFLVADSASTEPTFVFSLSDSAPTGCTNYLLIRWFYNGADGAGAIDVSDNFMGAIKPYGDDVNECSIFLETDISNPGASYIDMEDANGDKMEIKMVTSGRKVDVGMNASIYKTSSGNAGYIRLVVDGDEVKAWLVGIDSGNITVPGQFEHTIEDLEAGEHTFEFEWKGDNMQQNGATVARTMYVREK